MVSGTENAKFLNVKTPLTIAKENKIQILRPLHVAKENQSSNRWSYIMTMDWNLHSQLQSPQLF